MSGGSKNPRRANGSRRNKLIERAKQRCEPCWICGQPIDLTLPAGHPMSFELDEEIPVSKWMEYGYPSAKACALDPNNAKLSTHRRCNNWRGNKTVDEVLSLLRSKENNSLISPNPTRNW